MVMRADDDFIKNLIVQTIRDFDPKAKILLFGSRARGDARVDSDWDVLVLVEGDRVTHEQFLALNYDLWVKGFDYGHDINSIVHTFKQWNSAPPSLFKHNVMTESIEL